MNAPETVFPLDRMKTDKTAETDCVGNGDFLRAVFGADLTDALPVVVSFAGNPASVPGKVWFGRQWPGGTDAPVYLPADANNYFSLAVFRPDEAGQYRRQKARFGALYAVMLDDVGSKVAMDRLTLPPSWLLKTSPGNHQAGYLLRDPLADGMVADHPMDAIVAAGLCDPGANGPRAARAAAEGGERQTLAAVLLPVGGLGAGTPLFGRGSRRRSSVGNDIDRAAQAAGCAQRAGAPGRW